MACVDRGERDAKKMAIVEEAVRCKVKIGVVIPAPREGMDDGRYDNMRAWMG